MTTVQERIGARLEATGKSARQASLNAGLSADTIGKILKNTHMSPTLQTIDKLAVGLETTPQWLAYGIEPGKAAAGFADDLVVNRRLLSEALRFVLHGQGVDPEQADLVANIFSEALEGPAVDAVDRDPLLSFQVHLQLQAGKAGGSRRQ